MSLVEEITPVIEEYLECIYGSRKNMAWLELKTSLL
jgi:hypothetical protein